MKRSIIDTNALISFVTDRDPTQQAKIANVLEGAARLHWIVLCPQNVITEFVNVLHQVYGIAREDIKAMVTDFIAMPGVEIVHEIDMAALLRLWPQEIVDYGDAIVVAVAKSTAASEVVTFDSGLRAICKILKIRTVPDD
jgi:predicted nucleic-acid-binding protein